MDEVVMDRIDEAMVGVLSRSEKPLTIYKIAKGANLSWATVNTHCYKLKSQGVLTDSVFESGPGMKRTFWKLAATTPTLGKFT